MKLFWLQKLMQLSTVMFVVSTKEDALRVLAATLSLYDQEEEVIIIKRFKNKEVSKTISAVPRFNNSRKAALRSPVTWQCSWDTLPPMNMKIVGRTDMRVGNACRYGGGLLRFAMIRWFVF